MCHFSFFLCDTFTKPIWFERLQITPFFTILFLCHHFKEPETSRKIFVGRLSENLTSKDLQEYFAQYGQVIDVYIPKPFRAFGFVTFVEADIAQGLCGESHLIKGVSVHVSRADPKEEENSHHGSHHPGGNSFHSGGGGHHGGHHSQPPMHHHHHHHGGHHGGSSNGHYSNNINLSQRSEPSRRFSSNGHSSNASFYSIFNLNKPACLAILITKYPVILESLLVLKDKAVSVNFWAFQCSGFYQNCNVGIWNIFTYPKFITITAKTINIHQFPTLIRLEFFD